MRRLSTALVFGIFSFVLSGPLFALPRFALDAGVSCQECHVNPTGGGMRNEFGAEYYSRTVLPMRTSRQTQGLEGFSTRLNEFIRVGTDLRTVMYYIDDGRNTRSSFWQMQGDLYVSAQVSRDLTFYLDKGLYDGFEIFGLLSIPSMNSYLKVGTFVPAYGIRMDDHILYTRAGGAIPFFVGSIVPVPFGERAEDTGVEFGYINSNTTLTIGMFNGNPGGGIRFAEENINAVALRGEWRLFSEGSTHGLIGGSFYRNRRTNFETINYGVFGGIGIERSFNVIGEMMFVSWKQPPTASAENYLLFFTEFNYLIQQGIELKMQYNLGTGGSPTLTRHAIGVGAEFFLVPGLELRPLYRIHFSNDVPNIGELLLMFHIFI